MWYIDLSMSHKLTPTHVAVVLNNHCWSIDVDKNWHTQELVTINIISYPAALLHCVQICNKL